MALSLHVLSVLVFTVLGPCYGRHSPILMEERFDDCPCEMQMGGHAHRPWKIYYEVERIGEEVSEKKCSEFTYGPMPLKYNFPAQDFCTDSTIAGNGSYIVRSCIRENDDDADMKLFSIRRLTDPNCGTDESKDEIDTQENRKDCDSNCSSECDSVEPSITTEPSPSSSPASIVDVVPNPQPVVRVSKYLNPAIKLIHGAIVTEEDIVPYVVWTAHLPTNIRNDTLRTRCTGSLIGKRWVLTAGHCNNAKRDAVLIGRRWDDTTGEIKEEGKVYRVRNVYLSPNYKLIRHPCDTRFVGVHNGDVALLELNSDVDNAEDKAIHVNTDCRFPHACSHLRMSGHGLACTATEEERIRGILRTTVVTAIDPATCHKKLKKAGLTLADAQLRAEPHICALHDECGSGLCSGDSGGPLVMRRRKDKRMEGDGSNNDGSDDDDDGTIPVQVGVAIWHVNECGRKDRPDVFEPVSAYAQWIYNTTNGEAKMYPPIDKRTPEMSNCLLECWQCDYNEKRFSNYTVQPGQKLDCAEPIDFFGGGKEDECWQCD